jgi:hypothetical protein
MRTAGICPEMSGMVLACGTLLQQDLGFLPGEAPQNKDRKGPMQQALLMGGQFLGRADFQILFIHQDDLGSHIFCCWHGGFSSKIERPKYTIIL